MDEKPFDLDERTGNVILRFGGEVYTARPPTFGENRKLEEYADTVGAEPETDPDAPEIGGLVPRFEEYVGWWYLLFQMCGDKPLPEDKDQLPVWLGSPLAPALVRKTLQHFISHPFPGLGAFLATGALIPTEAPATDPQPDA